MKFGDLNIKIGRLITFFLVAILCVSLFSKGDLYAQKFASARSYAFATIVSASDTLLYKQTAPLSKIQLEEEIKIGLSANEVTDILGYPLEKIKVVYGNKEKWIYDGINIYFENNMVKIIQKKNLAAIS